MMTNGKPCESLEKECEEARKKWEAARDADLGALPPATDPLTHETPTGSGTLSTAAINLRRRYDDCAARLSKCHEEHNIPQIDQLRVRQIGSKEDQPENS